MPWSASRRPVPHRSSQGGSHSSDVDHGCTCLILETNTNHWLLVACWWIRERCALRVQLGVRVMEAMGLLGWNGLKHPRFGLGFRWQHRVRVSSEVRVRVSGHGRPVAKPCWSDSTGVRVKTCALRVRVSTHSVLPVLHLRFGLGSRRQVRVRVSGQGRPVSKPCQGDSTGVRVKVAGSG